MGTKKRITVSLEQHLIVKAKRLAHQRGIRLSELVEFSLQASFAGQPTRNSSFVERWAGKFSVREDEGNDPRLKALKAKHDLS